MPISCCVSYCDGDENKKNWCYFRPGWKKEWIVLFPGDISDWHTSNTPFGNDYGLDTLMWITCAKYPDNPVLLIRAQIIEQFFAIYVNFLLVDSYGNPRVLPTSVTKSTNISITQPDAPRQLLKLVHCVRNTFRNEIEAAQREGGGGSSSSSTSSAIGNGTNSSANGSASADNGGDGKLKWDRSIPPLIIAAFSKGHVVLNSLLRRPTSDNEKHSFKTLWSNVRQMHYLDAGASGEVKGVFPTNFVIENFIKELELIPSTSADNTNPTSNLKMFQSKNPETASNSGDIPMKSESENGDSAMTSSIWSNLWRASSVRNLLRQPDEENDGLVPTGIFLHGTPRQLQDKSKNVREEWDACVDTCQKANLRFGYQEYFTNLNFDVFAPDRRADALAVHFKILEAFRIPGIPSQTIKRWKLSS